MPHKTWPATLPRPLSRALLHRNFDKFIVASDSRRLEDAWTFGLLSVRVRTRGRTQDAANDMHLGSCAVGGGGKPCDSPGLQSTG